MGIQILEIFRIARNKVLIHYKLKIKTLKIKISKYHLLYHLIERGKLDNYTHTKIGISLYTFNDVDVT